MKEIMRTVQEMGNGGHIYLPKELIGKQVLVIQTIKTIDDIKKEIVQILNPYLEHIIGIYLHGSYARNEQTSKSDIDIWIITDEKLKIKERIDSYEIISSTLEETKKELKTNAMVVLSMIREALPLLNRDLLKKLSKYKLNKRNTEWYLKTTKSSLAVVEDLMKDRLISSIPNLTYPLLMRLRGLYLIRCLYKNEKYTNKKLKDFLMKKGLKSEIVDDLYDVYQAARDNKKIPYHKIDYVILKKLYAIVNGLLTEVIGYEKISKKKFSVSQKSRGDFLGYG